MEISDVKDMAVQAKDFAGRMLDEDSPVQRARAVAKQADGTVREFARDQPVLAVVMAVAAGYLVGRVVASVS